MRFSSIESIVVRYQYYRIGIHTFAITIWQLLNCTIVMFLHNSNSVLQALTELMSTSSGTPLLTYCKDTVSNKAHCGNKAHHSYLML